MNGRNLLLACVLVATLSLLATAGRRPAAPDPPDRLTITLPVESPNGIDLGSKGIASLADAERGRFRLGVESEPRELGLPIRWGETDLESASLYSLHSLEPAWHLRNLYLETRDARALTLALEIALDYRARNPLLFPEHSMAWSEHPAANRAIVYMHLGELAAHRGDLRAGELFRAALECALFASRRSQWVSGHNHGLFVAVALMTVGKAMDREELLAVGNERFLDTWSSIVAEGFLLEHNPSYQMAIAELVRRLALVGAELDTPPALTERSAALRRGIKFLASPTGRIPRFGDNLSNEDYQLPGEVEIGDFWFPRAGYLGWRAPDAGVVVDLAAHSRVHSRGTASSLAVYDRGAHLGAYRTHAAYRWLCPGMGRVPRIGVAMERAEARLRRVRIVLDYDDHLHIQRVMTIRSDAVELRDTLDVEDPSACRMPVDEAAAVEGARLEGGVAVPQSAEIATTLPLSGDPLASVLDVTDLGGFDSVHVQPYDTTWQTLRRLGRAIRSPGKPPLALALALAGALASWFLSTRELHRGVASHFFFAVALVLATAGLVFVSLGAFL